MKVHSTFMEVVQPPKANPLGLNLDFLFGRGFLWAKNERLNDWITLDSLRMEIPDLQFPFDAGGGISRFRHTRCLVREIELSISEAGLQDLLQRAAEQLEGFEDLRVRLNDGAAHVSLKLSAFGADTHVSFRVALIPPEPPRVDEVHLSIYDYRAFGPLPYPARVLAFELLKSLLTTSVLRPPGRGDSFTVGIAGDILSFRPIKLLLLFLFPNVGWKLPNLAGVVLDGVKIRPGQLSVRASARAETWHERPDELDAYRLLGTLEGARAIAAYEAKDLFSAVDQVLFEGDINRALEQLTTFREIYGAHPELVSRTFDCLLADPNPTNLAEAKALAAESLREDPEDLQALLALPTIATVERAKHTEILDHLDRLAAVLRGRQDLDDWVLCELSAAELLYEREPDKAAERLREILKLSPRNVEALERLRKLYVRVAHWSGYEEVLKRLTGVYTERDALRSTYLELARHLMDRRGESGEARIYLEKVLRLDPGNLEALDILGEGYLMSNEALRALKAFGTAARAAQARGSLERAALLHQRVAVLWRDELHNAAEALLSARRALQLQEESERVGREQPEAMLSSLEMVASLSEARERWDEALGYRTRIIPYLEELLERPVVVEDDATSSALAGVASLGSVDDESTMSWRDRLTSKLEAAERAIAMLYLRRERPDAAAPHWRRVLELNPSDEQASSHLEQHIRASGRPDQLIGLYKEMLVKAERVSRKVEVHLKLSKLYETLQMIEEASDQLRDALRLDASCRPALDRLVDLLRGAGRYETLRDVLSTLLVRLHERQLRHDVLLILARLQLDSLSSPRQATRSFFEALDINPTDLDALEGARDALGAVIEKDGHDAPAPVGPDTSAKLLERVLQRLVDLREDPLDRAQLLDEVAALARARGASGAASEALRRAQVLRADAARDGQEAGTSVDERLDSLLGPAGQEPRAEPPAPKPVRQPVLSLPRFEAPRPKPARVELHSKPTAEYRAVPKPVVQVPAEPAAQAPSSAEPPKPEVDWEQLSEAFEQVTREVPQDPEDLPAPLFDPPEDARAGGAPAAGLDDFRARLRDVLKAPGSLSAASRENPSVANFLGRAKAELGAPHKLNKPAAPESLASLTARIDTARQADDHDTLARTLREAIERHDDPEDDVAFADEHAARLLRELGETLFYELEQNEPARQWLERARALDPDGVGEQTSLLNALESIYEDGGDVERRVDLLEARLRATDSEDMATTYRLLLAQLIWDELRDQARAEGRLREVIERDRRNESAHRLLAQIAGELGDWARSARYLEVVLSERSGGLDEVELERELATIYLTHLDQPARAKRHFEGVLKAAPADAQAIEGIKQCQAVSGDWDGYLGSLGRELELLLGRDSVKIEHGLALDPDSVSPSLRSAASQIISDAAHIAQEQMHQLELASELWLLSFDLWGENIEALEKRLELDRELSDHAALAEDLEAWSDQLLDVVARFDALYEAARIWRDRLGGADRARQILAEAIAMVEGHEPAPAELVEARRALVALTNERL